MHKHELRSFSLYTALIVCALLLQAAAALASDLASQSTRAAGVSVSVKPIDLSPSAKTWRFQVALNTHSVDLSDDLAQTAILVDAAGKSHLALGWDGDPAGGHHRRGVLRFKPLSPPPDGLELRIARPGEEAPRTFRWRLR